MKRIKGFTLTELMVAATLGLILLMMVGYTLNNASRAVNGTMQQVAFQTRTRNIIRIMRKDIENMVPYSCFDGSATHFPKKTPLTGFSTKYGLIFLTHSDSLNKVTKGKETDLEHDLIWVYYMVNSSGSSSDTDVKLQRWWFRADAEEPDNLTKAFTEATSNTTTTIDDDLHHDILDISINATDTTSNAANNTLYFDLPDFTSSDPLEERDNSVSVTITLYNAATEEDKEFTFTAAMPVR